MMDNEDINQTEIEEIKSTAIVKYSLPKPAQFTKLQCNTDLNMPPSNWLSSSADSYGLQHVLSHPKGFSSFRMAHMFPDCVGEVDVVSDAENIKKLLKIPYHKGHVSMMVHRVENTLLIDDFDIYKHLLKTAETEWEWLKKFFFENINRATYEEDKNMFIQSRRREALKEKSLVSKFLYYSLVPTENAEPGNIKLVQATSSHSVQGPMLPEPAPHSECPDPPTNNQDFSRNVLWTFEDIEMLIGTDLPIFGGGTHPCISLRLRDMNKPISVLTGIDYWLDNLMSNVPEVVMCYHLNGIVQKYELIKTEDLPRMDNSKFSPKLIRDVAQSILSFLKSNATRAGHTYWLFKGKDEEVIKLYDLTSLCSEDDVEKGLNPFTIPVAMLLYRVARNMKHSTERRQPGTIRMLLKNCLKLLPAEKYPEIVTSSLYMLSDLYVPANTNPENPELSENEQDEDSESVFDDDISEKDTKEEATKILVLDNNRLEKFHHYHKSPPPILGGVEERCLQALQYVASGLDCIKYFPETKCNSKSKEEDEIRMAKPFEPIPMPYSKLNDESSKECSKKSKKKDRKRNKQEKKQEDTKVENKNALLPKQKNEAQPLPMWTRNIHDISWKDHLKTLLYEKAVLVYATLSEFYFVNGQYGTSLRNIGLLARCQLIMNKLLYTSNALRENCLLGRAGDCCIRMVQTWGNSKNYSEQLHNNTDEDLKMMEQLEQDERCYYVQIADTNMKCVFIYDIRTIEQILLKAVECYEMALKISETESILRRLGNSLNELASYFLNIAKTEKTEKDIQMTCKKAEPYLVRGLEIFEKVKDEANTALLYANMGHLHRLLAHTNTPSDRGELTQREKLHYNKAFINYKKALQVLGERHHCPSVWDAVKWELSTALFTMGSIMHENPPSHLSKAEAEKEVIEILQKALQYCDFDENNPKLPLYQYRAAIIHYRIGSLYHNHIWSTANDPANRKNIIQLAKINYEKAAKLYFRSSDVVNYFTAQMQKLALSEYLVETTSATNTKIKHLQHCLDIMLELEEMITLIVEKKIDISEEETKKDEDSKTFKTCFSLLKLIKRRLQHILKQLIKICSNKPPPNKDCPKLLLLYKNCFKLSFDLKDDLDYNELSENLYKVLKNIKIEIENFSI